MIKLANKIALASLLGAEEGMDKSASLLAIPTAVGALAGGLVGNAQRNEDSDAMWPADDHTQNLKPALGALTGAAAGLPAGLLGYDIGGDAASKLSDITRNIKNKKAKAILSSMWWVPRLGGLIGGSAGTGALSGYGISKMIDL